MAGSKGRDSTSRESYMQLLRKSDTQIASLLDQGFAFVTNAFQPGQAPPGIPVPDCERVAAKLRGDGWEVVLAPAYDEAGQSLPSMTSLWRRRPEQPCNPFPVCPRFP